MFAIRKRSLDLFWNGVIKTNRILTRLRSTKENVIWVVGDGRSGTTWLANLINYHGKYRYMFEPFHPKLVAPMNGLKTFQYIRPGQNNPYFVRLANKVFTGQFQHSRVDAFNRSVLYRGLLIKDIFTNLFIKWVASSFPMVKIVWLLRHPCAVAISKEKNIYGFWMKEPKEFFSQDDLVEDFLYPFRHVINSANTFLEKQMVIWSIVHYVPFRQLVKGEVHLVFYEDLCTNPDREMKRIFAYIDNEQNVEHLDLMLSEEYSKPSMATSFEDSAIYTGKDLIKGWREQLTNKQVETVVQILSQFALDQIYNEDFMPNREAAQHMLEES